MRNPQNVLNNLTKHSKDKNYQFERLYRLLYNKEMYLVAYQTIYANPGHMTPGVDELTIDGMSMARIDQLIDSLKMNLISHIHQDEPIFLRRMGSHVH